MGCLPHRIKRVGRGAIVVLLTAALFAGPAIAASNHQNYRSENNDSVGNSFNLDQDPCRDPSAHRRHGNGACPDQDNGFSAHGQGSSQHPGSSAFGLQFNSGY